MFQKKTFVHFFTICMTLMFGTTSTYATPSSGVTSMTGEMVKEIYASSETNLAKASPANKLSKSTRSFESPLFAPNQRSFTELDEWSLLESVSSSYSIPAGEHYALRLDLDQRTVEEIALENELSDYALAAIDRAPMWIRNELRDNFIAFGNWFVQDEIAAHIMNIEDPYVDELAFVFAHISPIPISQGLINWNFDLIIENVEDVYAADEDLDYVQINDYGTSEDDNYYSTTEYTIVTAEGATTTIEIDPEIYYWYVVHPRITDELPTYINPTTGRESSPPEGKFWRSFLLNEAEEGYTSLMDQLDGCEIMYGNLLNDSSDDNGAIGRITRWVQDTMEFGSGSERPIQPVRIYHLHLGRCGEHQDITAAAARAALIPTLGSCTMNEDHVWNEFWDGTQWVTWEPVNTYIGNSLVYEQEWERVLPTVFNWRGDGYIWTVTERYRTEWTTLTMRILDASDHPVDGARVLLYSEARSGGLTLASANYSDTDGYVDFTIGGSRNFYVSVSSVLGDYPAEANQCVMVVENSDASQEYDGNVRFDTSLEVSSPAAADYPADPDEHFMLHCSAATMHDAAYGGIFTNDDFIAPVGEGNAPLFVCDESNYSLYCEGEAYEAYSLTALNGTETESDFTFPSDDIWYLVFDNSNDNVNYQRFSFDAELYIDDSLVDTEETLINIPSRYALLPNVPNPFNASTRIRFDLARPGSTQLTIYNMMGQEILSRSLGNLSAGRHEIPLHLSNAASGAYLYTLESGTFHSTGRMMLLK